MHVYSQRGACGVYGAHGVVFRDFVEYGATVWDPYPSRTSIHSIDLTEYSDEVPDSSLGTTSPGHQAVSAMCKKRECGVRNVGVTTGKKLERKCGRKVRDNG